MYSEVAATADAGNDDDGHDYEIERGDHFLPFFLHEDSKINSRMIITIGEGERYRKLKKQGAKGEGVV